MEDIQDPEEQHQEALASGASGVHFFKGQKLLPFSWGRSVALQRLMKDELSALEINVAIVYLCTLPAERVEVIRGTKERSAFLAEAGGWAESQGVRPGNDVDLLLSDTAQLIWAEYTTAKTVPAKEGGDSSGESSLAA